MFSIVAAPIYIPTTDVPASTFSTMLNKKGKSGYPYLVPDLRGKVLSFPVFSMILAVSLLYMAFNIYVDVYSLYTQYVESFYHERMINFC